MRLTLIFFYFFFVLNLHAREASSRSPVVINIFPERQQERRQSRWTLGSWMETKKQIEAQNRWLWAHTNKLPIEWALSLETSPRFVGGDFDFYLARLGIKAKYLKHHDWLNKTDPFQGYMGEVSAQIRLFGGNLQDSYLVARVAYEYNDFDTSEGFAGPYTGMGYGPELQIYLSQWLGARSEWRLRHERSRNLNASQTLKGQSLWITPFIEMGALRLEAGYLWDRYEFGGNYKKTIINQEIISRVRLFF